MHRILVVDDEKESVEMLSRNLSRRGYEVETANTGEEGVKRAQQSKFDIVLLDIQLPGMDGVRTLEEIKKINPETEFIMMTGFGSVNSAIDSMQKGAYDYLEKPFSNDKIAISIEKALEKHWLTEKVKERTFELTQANKELSKRSEELKFANKAKSEFLANMSHELRTPLNSIIGFSEVLFDEKTGTLNDQQREFLNYILSSGKHLHVLINEVLDLAKVEAGKMDLVLSSVLIKSLVEDVVILIREMVFKKKIKMSLEIPEDIGALEVDQRKVKQVLLNLFSNAVNFTSEGGKIGVRVKKNDLEIEVDVWDTGVGIAPEELGRMFEYFHRIDTAYSRAVEGSGLGLAYSKRLVDLHGGRIWIESEGLNKGTTVKFTLPYKR